MLPFLCAPQGGARRTRMASTTNPMAWNAEPSAYGHGVGWQVLAEFTAASSRNVLRACHTFRSPQFWGPSDAGRVGMVRQLAPGVENPAKGFCPVGYADRGKRFPRIDLLPALVGRKGNVSCPTGNLGKRTPPTSTASAATVKAFRMPAEGCPLTHASHSRWVKVQAALTPRKNCFTTSRSRAASCDSDCPDCLGSHDQEGVVQAAGSVTPSCRRRGCEKVKRC